MTATKRIAKPNPTNISWATHTFNPLYKNISHELGRVAHGCNKVSPACSNCYSELMNVEQRFLGDGKPYKGISYNDMYFDRPSLKELSKGKKQKAIFICSMTDWAAVNEFVRMDDAVDLLQACATSKHLCYLLTKRAECLPEILRLWQIKYRVDEWPPNVWLGFTAENQKWFDKRWQHFTDEDGVLGRFSDVNVFVSYEPALDRLVLPESFYYNPYRVGHREPTHEPLIIKYRDNGTAYSPELEFKKLNTSGGRWLIAGGESGTKARKYSDLKKWFVDIKNQCNKSGVKFFFKQWGTYIPKLNEWIVPGAIETAQEHQHDMVNGARRKDNDLLFGQAFKDTPLNRGS